MLNFFSLNHDHHCYSCRLLSFIKYLSLPTILSVFGTLLDPFLLIYIPFLVPVFSPVSSLPEVLYMLWSRTCRVLEEVSLNNFASTLFWFIFPLSDLLALPTVSFWGWSKHFRCSIFQRHLSTKYFILWELDRIPHHVSKLLVFEDRLTYILI